MDAFQDDLLVEILRRLSRKSRHRCMAVSKRWNKIISVCNENFAPKSTDSNFAFIEDKFCTRPCDDDKDGLFLRLGNEGIPVEEEPFIITRWKWNYVAFSNGLLFYQFRPRLYLGDSVYYVANYSMKQKMSIPPHPDIDNKYYIVGLGLRFDSESKQRFKVVIVLQLELPVTFDPEFESWTESPPAFRDDGCVKVGTFDPETGVWTTHPAQFSDVFKHFESEYANFSLHSPPVYLDEALYWVHSMSVNGPSCQVVVILCLMTNKFHLIDLPHYDNRNLGLLWESEGRLKYGHICPTEGLRI